MYVCICSEALTRRCGQLYLKLGFAKSKSECRKLIEGGGAKLNDEKISDVNLVIRSTDLSDPIKLSMGKKKHGLVVLA